MGKLGALLMKKDFKKMALDLDYTQLGGSPFLGVKKLVIKSHGSSKAKTIYSCVMQAYKLYQNKTMEKIKESINSLGEDSEK